MAGSRDDRPGGRSGGDAPPGLGEKARIATLVSWDFLGVSLLLRRTQLPALVSRLQRPPRLRIERRRPRRLGAIVDRVLRLGPYRPRCLVLSLVLFRLLQRQGTPSELVIGLPREAASHEAHAWIEVDGEVVGPPPGRLGHSEMARYGGSPPDGPS